MAQRASKVSANVLIVGENGVGKEFLARQIHRFRDPDEKDFRVYHCHGDEMDVAEIRNLFQQKPVDVMKGPVTVFLKSLDEIDLKHQLQLLEILEEESFINLSKNAVNNSKPRLICSCVKDTHREIESVLLQRLAYRLDIIHIEIPPLRERKEEILPLADLFLHEFKGKYDKPVGGFTPKIRTSFLMHSWPGNVRELRNAVEQGVILAKDHLIDKVQLN
jgi:DNA-binding NtrC family response regulator